MSWVTGLFVYVIIWWVVLFAVLPWGARPPEEAESGHMAGAPARAHIWRKLAVTSVVAGVLWVGAYFLITSDVISFREMAK